MPEEESEKEVAIVKVRTKAKKGEPALSYVVTIPKNEVADELGLTGGERVKVLFDAKRRRIIYELMK